MMVDIRRSEGMLLQSERMRQLGVVPNSDQVAKESTKQ
jgi:hypothetical protein